MMVATFLLPPQTGRLLKVKLTDECKAALERLEMRCKNLVINRWIRIPQITGLGYFI